ENQRATLALSLTARKPARRGLRSLPTVAICLYFLCAGDPSRAQIDPPNNCVRPPLGVIVPLYFYPTPPPLGMEHPWQRLVDMKIAYPRIDIWAIINSPTDPDACSPKIAGCECNVIDDPYMAALELLQTHGIRMMGYVTTGHAKVADPSFRTCIETRINAWQ